MAQLDTRVLTTHVPLPLAEKVDALAQRLDRSRGWVVKQALAAWIDQEEERSRLTHEALADVATGRVIDHEQVKWSGKALDDIERLYDFLAKVNKSAAAQTVLSLVAAAARLIENPRIGESLDEFAPLEVRRILVGRYEVRYQVESDNIYVLRLWHTREDR
jgi:plasmid stabilization system protein ParE